MAALTGIRIERYRGFRSFEASGFTRINLIVGQNDVGKTALLEALEIALSGGHPGRLFLQSQRRREFHRAPGSVEGLLPSPGPWWDVRHWFNGRELRPDLDFTIVPTPGEATRVELKAHPNGSLVLQGFGPTVTGFWTAVIRGDAVDSSQLSSVLSAVGPETSRPRSLDTALADPTQVGELWDEAVRAGTAGDVARLVSVVDPAVTSVLVGDPSGVSGWGGVVATVDRRPVSVASLGEGVKRAVVLALAVSVSRGSQLLIDELDLGLHYSVFPKLWEQLAEALRELNVQLFATTHSDDCLRGLVTMLGRRPEFAGDVSLYRLDRGRNTPVRSTGPLLADAIESSVEVR